MNPQLIKVGISAAACFAVFKYVSNPAVKSAAIGVLGIIVAKQLPYIKDSLA